MQQTEAGGDQSFDRPAPGEHGDHAQAPKHDDEKLGRAHQVDQRPGYGNRQYEREGADQATHTAGHERGAERAPALAFLSHRVAVENCGLGAGAAGNAKKYRQVSSANRADCACANE